MPGASWGGGKSGSELLAELTFLCHSPEMSHEQGTHGAATALLKSGWKIWNSQTLAVLMGYKPFQISV